MTGKIQLTQIPITTGKIIEPVNLSISDDPHLFQFLHTKAAMVKAKIKIEIFILFIEISFREDA